MTRHGQLALAWVAAMAIGASGCNERSAHDPYALMEGQGIYKDECAACHGANLEGQANWQTRRPDGKLPAPPHDKNGHTWHHPREQLAAIVKFGMVPPHAPPGYVSDMPAFGGKLTDAQIDNVLAWIESQWPQEILKRRAEMLKGDRDDRRTGAGRRPEIAAHGDGRVARQSSEQDARPPEMSVLFN